jgi:hypothetical protein
MFLRFIMIDTLQRKLLNSWASWKAIENRVRVECIHSNSFHLSKMGSRRRAFISCINKANRLSLKERLDDIIRAFLYPWRDLAHGLETLLQRERYIGLDLRSVWSTNSGFFIEKWLFYWQRNCQHGLQDLRVPSFCNWISSPHQNNYRIMLWDNALQLKQSRQVIFEKCSDHVAHFVTAKTTWFGTKHYREITKNIAISIIFIYPFSLWDYMVTVRSTSPVQSSIRLANHSPAKWSHFGQPIQSGTWM